MTNLWQDLRYATRMLLKKPGFTLITITTLGLGIGVNTALYAGFNLLLRPTPIKDPGAVVKIERQNEDGGRDLLLTESVLLAFAGGAAAMLLARWSVALLFPWVFARSDGRDFAKTALSLSLDWRVLVFAMSLSLLSGGAFGLVPALRATRPDLVAVINAGHEAVGGHIARSRLRNGLVVAQVALCFVLLIPAGLLLRALAKALASDRGYESNNLLVVEYK